MRLDRIVLRDGSTIEYVLADGVPLKHLLKGNLRVGYEDDMEAVPDSVRIVPLLGILAPVVWVTGSTLEIPTVDREFWEFLQFWQGKLQALFPEHPWPGRILPQTIVNGEGPGQGTGTALLFSGGLDSVTAYLRHRNEALSLVTIRGFDMRMRNRQAWETTRALVSDFAASERIPCHFLAVNFRDWLDEDRLCSKYHLDWWVEVAHATISASLAVPLAYHHGQRRIFQASGAPETCSGTMRWAADPQLVNAIRAVGVQVASEGAELTRQEKIAIYAKATRLGDRLPLRVCWKDRRGVNCGRCEKCSRSIVGLMLEGLDPADHGFPIGPRTLKSIRGRLEQGSWEFEGVSEEFWLEIKRRLATPVSLSFPAARQFFAWLELASVESLRDASRRNPRRRLKSMLRSFPPALEWTARKMYRWVRSLWELCSRVFMSRCREHGRSHSGSSEPFIARSMSNYITENDGRQICTMEMHLDDAGKKIVYGRKGLGPVSRYFRRDLWIEYDVPMDRIPPGVRMAPFLALVAPVAWLTDIRLNVMGADRELVLALEKNRELFQRFYPRLRWEGGIFTDEQAPLPDHPDCSGCGLLFSAGVDSLFSYFRLRSELSGLVLVHGLDIVLGQICTWANVLSLVREFSARHNVALHTIRTNVRDALDEERLGRDFAMDWWPAVAHGILIAALALPLAVAQGWGRLFEASGSPAAAASQIVWGANPELVDNLRCTSVRVVCDGGEMTRQEKVRFLARIIREEEPNLQMHACWKDMSGGNCGRCEKCCRTMVGLFLEGVDPGKHGFPARPDLLPYVRRCLENGEWLVDQQTAFSWASIGDNIRRQKRMFADGERQRFVDWLATVPLQRLVASSAANPKNQMRALLARWPRLFRMLRRARRRLVNR